MSPVLDSNLMLESLCKAFAILDFVVLKLKMNTSKISLCHLLFEFEFSLVFVGSLCAAYHVT